MIDINNTNFNPDAARPEWMNDELVKDIPAEKLNFLSLMFAGSQGKSQKEMMMYLMPLIKQAKKDNLTLTPEEMNAAIAAIKKYSTAQELDKINNILNK
jgi:hypothetical protein